MISTLKEQLAVDINCAKEDSSRDMPATFLMQVL